jgi:hypoxanthine phosphoribosyltransferase
MTLPPLTEHDVVGPAHLSAEAVATRVTELGAEITKDYRDADLLLVSVLKGAIFFMADLARTIGLPLEMDFLAITSYADEAKTGDRPGIRFIKDLDEPVSGKDVLIVEDVIDTGLTLHYILRSLSLRGPRSLQVCTLLDRPYRRLVDIDVRYVGFTVPDDFFVGYGFDYRQRYRNLPDIRFLRI